MPWPSDLKEKCLQYKYAEGSNEERLDVECDQTAASVCKIPEITTPSTTAPCPTAPTTTATTTMITGKIIVELLPCQTYCYFNLLM